MRRNRLFVGAALLWVSAASLAGGGGEMCVVWTCSGAPGDSLGAACGAAAAEQNSALECPPSAIACTSSYTLGSCNQNGTTAGSTGSCDRIVNVEAGPACPPGNPGNQCGTGTFTESNYYGGTAAEEECPEPCTDMAESPARALQGDSGGLPEAVCDPAAGGGQGCRMELGGVGVALGSGAWAGNYVYTGGQCGGDEPAGEPGDENEEKCVEGSGGFEVCTNPTGEGQCGSINGKFVCLKKTPAQGCQLFSDGGKVCAQQAPTPPVPDNGTPGTKADPDEVVTVTRPGSGTGSSTTLNYYNSTTVGNSNRDPNDLGPVIQDPEAGPDGDGDGTGSGVVDDETACDGGACDQSVPELEDIGTMQEAFAQFWSGLNAVPMVAAVQGAAASVPSGGSCPAWSTSVSLYSQSFDIDFGEMICGLWDELAPLLSALFLAIWAWLSFKILFSA